MCSGLMAAPCHRSRETVKPKMRLQLTGMGAIVATMRTARPKRFKVQRRVDLWARDRSNKPFLLGTVWRTESQADKQGTAENIMRRRLVERPAAEFRIAEEWPLGMNLRTILTARMRPKAGNRLQSVSNRG